MEELSHLIIKLTGSLTMNGDILKKEFGDYQTPLEFADTVCNYLYTVLHIRPQYIIEPTAGIGNFIKSSLKYFPAVTSVLGIEMNKKYCDVCNSTISDKRVKIKCQNIFECDLETCIENDGETLVIGNPPWATNAELNYNLPQKSNFKGRSGIEAITGSSNFDICEYIILRLIEAFRGKNAVIAMLCKTSVARNLFMELNRTSAKAEYVKMLNFDSGKVFGISAPTCLFVVKLSNSVNNTSKCVVADIYYPEKILNEIQWKDGSLFSIVQGVKDLEGSCQYEWRQGIKHDCSSVMELERVGKGIYRNKRKEEVKLEDKLVFPLIKSSHFKQPVICEKFKKYVIVTQKKPREDTSYIKRYAPNTWRYLESNKEQFDGRKSSIYSGAPEFSMFGVGDYSYAKYKVGISGFYKTPFFSLLYNNDELGNPIMLDDTTYFISFSNYDDAYTCMLLLNCDAVKDFLYSISFKDAKRPYTKKILQRLDFRKCVAEITIDEMIQRERKLNLKPYITENMYLNFKRKIG